MRVVVIGKGTIGSAVSKVLEQKGHEVVPVSRNSGEFRADISDSESLKALFSSIGSFDAVAKAAGDVFPGPYEQTTDEQRVKSIKSKGMGQINLVRVALPFIADKGSFTLKSGVLTDEYMLIPLCLNRPLLGTRATLRILAEKPNVPKHKVIALKGPIFAYSPKP
jgi:NAD(P)-dependent dehydrogenase (short-subunit alcohol dehydrogenase family)